MLEPEEIRISPMPKTWILDLDGTILVHDGPYIIFGPGQGERIMINDNKPDGLVTAIAVNTTRDKFCQTDFVIDHSMGTM